MSGYGRGQRLGVARLVQVGQGLAVLHGVVALQPLRQPVRAHWRRAQRRQEAAERVARQYDAKVVSARTEERNGRRVHVIRILTREGVVEVCILDQVGGQCDTEPLCEAGETDDDIDAAATTDLVLRRHREVREVAYGPAPLSASLGPYVPLIVVNCLILGRQEAFASKRHVGRALLDALGTAAGFTIAMLMMGTFREVVGSGTLFQGTPWPGAVNLFGPNYEPWVVMISPPGGFFALGFILLFLGWWETRKAQKREIRHWPHSVRVPTEKEAA